MQHTGVMPTLMLSDLAFFLDYSDRNARESFEEAVTQG